MQADNEERGNASRKQGARAHAARHEEEARKPRSEADGPAGGAPRRVDPAVETPKAHAHRKDRETEAAENAGEIAKLKGEVQALQDKYLRAIADFDNYRKRVARENEERIRCANQDLILRLLEVIDNMERAFAAAEGTKDWDGLKKGLELTYGHMRDILAREGLCPIECLGRRFDPNYHEAVMVLEKEGTESENVIEEIQKGYTLGGKVIRPSKVVVSK